MTEEKNWQKQLAMAVIASMAHQRQEGHEVDLMNQLKPFLPEKASRDKLSFNELKNLVDINVNAIERDMKEQTH